MSWKLMKSKEAFGFQAKSAGDQMAHVAFKCRFHKTKQLLALQNFAQAQAPSAMPEVAESVLSIWEFSGLFSSEYE